MNATKTKEIYARAAVQLRTHERAFEAEARCPGAMGLYLFLLLQARGEITSGDVAEGVAVSSWGGPTSYRRKQAAALVAAGLVELVDGRLVVVRYGDHNDVPEVIEANKASARERMRELRAAAAAKKNHPEPAPRSGDVRRTEGERSPDVPISNSHSCSESGSSEGSPEGRPKRPHSVRRFEEGFLTAAYAAGISSVTGCAYVVPKDEYRDLDDLVDSKHCPVQGEARDIWLRDTARRFAETFGSGRAKYGTGPLACMKWLNACAMPLDELVKTPDEAAAEYRERVRKASATIARRRTDAELRAAEADAMSPEQLAEAAQKALRALG